MREKTIHFLLKQACQITSQYDAQKERTGEAYNAFSILDVERREVATHSRVLFSLLLPDGAHGQKDKYLKLFLQEADVPSSLLERSWQVEREWAFPDGRIDFLLRCPEMCIALEMKIDAGDQDAQLVRYERYAKGVTDTYRICYLTLLGSSPSEQSMQGLDRQHLQLLSFSGHISRWLNACLQATPDSSQAYSLIQQYQYLINKLSAEDTMADHICSLIKSEEDLKGAIALANALVEIKTRILLRFFAQIQKEGASMGYPFDFYNPDSTKDYFSSRRGDQPSICYSLMELGTDRKTGAKKALCLSVELDWNLYAWIGFVELATDTKAWVPLTPGEIGKKFPGLPQKVLKSLAAIYEEPLKTQDSTLHWFYLRDSKGDEFNFRKFSDSCIRLQEDVRLVMEANRIAQRMTAEYQRLRAALKAIEE